MSNSENPGVATSGVFYSYFWQWEGLGPQVGCRLLITVQPFNDVMANYAARDSDKKRSNYIHTGHTFFLCQYRRRQRDNYIIAPWKCQPFLTQQFLKWKGKLSPDSFYRHQPTQSDSGCHPAGRIRCPLFSGSAAGLFIFPG